MPDTEIRSLTPLEARVRAWAEPRLSPERLAHTRGVVETAARLAERYGVGQVEALRLAGWIHDTAKALPADELLRLALAGNYVVRLVEWRAPDLLHGVVAGLLARDEVGLDDPAIFSAVAFHTTGDPGMSAADKILYLADALEPSRTFSWTEQGRKLADEDIDRAVLYVLSNKLRRLLRKSDLIDPRSIDLRNNLILESVKLTPLEA